MSPGIGEAATTDQNIQQANLWINNALITVLEAEKAGADVTELLISLNSAGKHLANAQNAYRSGNSEKVIENADQARIIAEQVSREAAKLKESSTATQQTNSILTTAFTTIGITVFLVVLFLVWRKFKRSYIKNLLQMKPKVIEETTKN